MSSITDCARITVNGTIILGRLIACDGHDYSRNHFVFSHIHSDHVGDFVGKCLHNGQVYTTKATMDLLEAIEFDTYARRTQFHVLEYDKPKLIEYGNHAEKLRLIESKHNLGAAQIEVYTEDKKKIVYSGDITSKDKPPDNIDYLIVDSTHGTPQFNTRPDESLRRRFIDVLIKAIKNNFKPVMIHASRGALQEIMSVVSQENFSKYKLLAQAKDVAAAKIYKNYGRVMREIIDEESIEGESIKENTEWPWIQFTTSHNATYKERMEEQYSIHFWSYNSGYQMKQNENSAHFLDGAHADYTSLLSYIALADPDKKIKIIVDNFRGQQGQKLVFILKELGYDAICQPM